MLARYLSLAVLLYCAAWGLGAVRAEVTHAPIEFKIADAWGYYAYLPAVVIDGNLTFENQPIYSHNTSNRPGAGRNTNRWPVGLALTIAPAFLLAHALAVPIYAATGWTPFTPDGYSQIYAVVTLAQLVAFAVFCLSLGERLLRERYDVRPAAAFAAVLVLAVGTNFLWYVLREPYMTHVANAS